MRNQEVATQLVESVHSMRATLRELYRADHHNPRDAARLNSELGEAIKLAEIHGVLAVADELRELREVIGSEPC